MRWPETTTPGTLKTLKTRRLTDSGTRAARISGTKETGPAIVRTDDQPLTRPKKELRHG